jgi:hypothetical protein
LSLETKGGEGENKGSKNLAHGFWAFRQTENSLEHLSAWRHFSPGLLGSECCFAQANATTDAFRGKLNEAPERYGASFISFRVSGENR